MKTCLNCQIELNSRSKKYCNNRCQQSHQRTVFIDRWKKGLEDGVMSHSTISRYIRNYLIGESNHSCSKCGWSEIHASTGICPLEIHHIDGNATNNRHENLEVLCPNCHSLTDNYRALNRDSVRERGIIKKNTCLECGEIILPDSTRCVRCELTGWNIPTSQMRVDRKTLKSLIRTETFTQIGIDFEVADNTIKKWCIKLNLPKTKKEINSFSEEEWLSI